MLPAIRLIDFGFRQLVGMVPEAQAKEALARMTGPAIQLVVRHFTDHSQTLPKALVNANDRAWQAVSIALSGNGLLDQIKVFFASADDKGIREQVRLFLQEKSIGYDGTPADFRQTCLDELNVAKMAGMLALAPKDVTERAANLQRYADPTGMVDGAEQVIGRIADEFASGYPNLSKLLRQPQAGGPALLVAAFAFFFRRAVETNSELAHGLFFDGLRKLSKAQEQSFEQLDRIENVGMATHEVVVETQEAVLDMQAEMHRLGSLPDEVRRLIQEVLNRVSQAGMQRGEVKPHHSFSVRSEEERVAVKQLLARFRQMPAEQQKQVPALLNGLGKLQFGSQDFDGAQQTFAAVAEQVHDATAQAEAHFNAYRAALEEKKWDDALAAILQAAKLDAGRFAPFPTQRYQAKHILGAGGFGTAFLCHDCNFDEEVVVKTLHDGVMERNMTDVFREARLLRKLNHPAIIGVHECEYAQPVTHIRPYIVMDYFAGGSLEDFIQKGNALSVEDLLPIALQIALGLRAAHEHGILHRDIKPDNILVRKDGSTWKVKIIDFGLALRKQTIETSMAARSAGDTILSSSVAGTVKYAPPEQMGEMKGVKSGPYSDVFSFGKMCCYAMFKTTEPKRRQWSEIPEELAEALEKCTEHDLKHRWPNFEPVLKVLEALDPAEARRKKEEEARQKAEPERQRREQEEAQRQRQQLERLQKDGETRLIELVRDALDRNNGKLVQADATPANELCKQHRIPANRAKQIVDEVKEEWKKAHHSKTERRVTDLDDDEDYEEEDVDVESNDIEEDDALEDEEDEDYEEEDVDDEDVVKAHWQKAHPAKTERKPGEIITNSLGMKFAWIPPGAFLMGSPKSEVGRRDEEEIQHKVTLTKGFCMGVHLVTQEQWQAVMGNNPSCYKNEPNLPVESVSWKDCQQFIKKLRENDKKAYRLPSEAEWEYACRAGTKTAYNFGDDKGMLGQYAWYTENSDSKTHPVGEKKPNAWGLFDMHGNVWEWCQDWFGDYPRNDALDPRGPNEGKYRVMRGGSWFDYPRNCRSAYRNRPEPAIRNYFYGLRVCFYLG